MLPPEFVERLDSQTYIDKDELLEALSGQGTSSVRVNRLKWPHPVTAYERVEWEPDGFYLPGRPIYTLDPLFHAGVYYPQESSGMFLGEMIRQLAGSLSGLRVLDLCGAPGGKSTHLASMLGDNSLLVANEIIRSRAAILAENITKWGTGNVIVTNADPSRFASLPGFFDIIVADLPCSGEGMFRSAAAVSEWSLPNTLLCSERQRRIVMDVWPALRPGGIFIYSTCTFNPAENEENVAWLTGQAGAEPLAVSLPADTAVTTIRYGGLEGYGFHPGRVRGEGFFIAAIRKPYPHSGSDESSLRGSSAPLPHLNRRGGVKLTAPALEIGERYTGFDPSRMAADEERIIALATERRMSSYIGEKVPVIKSGTLLGSLKRSGFVPAHDLAMTVRRRGDSWPVWPLTGPLALAYLSHDRLDGHEAPDGRALVTYRDIALGFVNNTGARINNGYPSAWRIRMRQPQRQPQQVTGLL